MSGIASIRKEVRRVKRELRAERGNLGRALADELGFRNPPKRARKRQRRSGVSMRSTAIPVAMTGVTSRGPAPKRRETFQFELDPIETGTTLKQVIPVGPGWIANARSTNIAKTATAYRIVNFKVTFMSAVSTGTAGTMTMGFVPFGFKVKMTDIQTYLRSAPGSATGNLYTSFTCTVDPKLVPRLYTTNGIWSESALPGFVVAKSTVDTASLGRFLVEATYDFYGETPGNHVVLDPGAAEVVTVSATSTVANTAPGDIYIMLEDYTVSTGSHLVYPLEAMVGLGSTTVRLLRDGILMDFDMDTPAGAEKDFEVLPFHLSAVD